MSNETPKISVIVPVYKTEKYLCDCVDSILGQTLFDIEVILVDDGSPDRCPQICDEYAKRVSRVKVIHKINEGLGYARNSGLEVAEGEYVTFVDSDDCISFDAYRRAYAVANAVDLDYVRFETVLFNDGDTVDLMKRWNDSPLVIGKEEIPELVKGIFGLVPKNDPLPFRVGGSVCMALFRRRIIQDNELRFRSEREINSEDNIFTMNFLMHSSKVGYLPSRYYFYRWTANSLTHTVRFDRIEKLIDYSSLVESEMNLYGFGEFSVKAATCAFINDSRRAIKQIFDSGISFGDKRSWFKEKTSLPYWKYCADNFPSGFQPLKNRIYFTACYRKLFIFTYLLSLFQHK